MKLNWRCCDIDEESRRVSRSDSREGDQASRQGEEETNQTKSGSVNLSDRRGYGVPGDTEIVYCTWSVLVVVYRKEQPRCRVADLYST